MKNKLALAVLAAFLFASGAGPVPSLPPDIEIEKSPRILEPLRPLTRTLSCGQLTGLAMPGVTITAAALRTSIDPPGPIGEMAGLPEYCRVEAEARPTDHSLIKIEIWVPTATYRNRYLQAGNGGFSGSVVYGALIDGIRRGYATASTDDGNQIFGSAEFAMEHPEKIIDYGHRALKETTTVAKAVIRALKGADPEYSYFHGCSNGGRQALMEAQRYPEDFDGILAGASANFFTHQLAAFAHNAQLMYEPGSLIPEPETFLPPPPTVPPYLTPRLPPSVLFALSREVLAQCAGDDGGLDTDKFLTNPPRCRVNLGALSCEAGVDPATCLTSDQRAIVQSIYNGVSYDSGRRGLIYPGFEPGAEWHPCNWALWLTGKPAASFPCGLAGPHIGFQALFGAGFFKYFVYGLPAYDVHTLNFSTDIVALDAALADKLNAVNPDLRAFRARGGKLIQYHGFDDAAVAPKNSINYWASVEAKMRERVRGFTRADLDSFYRLFMAPGLGHCGGGFGLNTFGQGGLAPAPYDTAEHDILLALERWVETGVPPERIIARHATEFAADFDPPFERPLCPYPKLPAYSGVGPETAASSWTCVSPRLKLPPIIRKKLRPDIILPPLPDPGVPAK